MEKKRKVIINADDFGITVGVNKAIIELAKAGALTSTSVMANMPDHHEIVRLKNKIGIGIHFNLTTGKPIVQPARVRSLIDEEGHFLEMPELIKRMKKKQLIIQEVELELNSQAERLVDSGIRIDHCDSHESLLKYPFLMSIIKKVATKHQIQAVRTYRPRKFDRKRLLNPRKILISGYLAFQRMKWKQDRFRVADRYDSLLQVGLDFKSALDKLREIFSSEFEGTLELATHPGYCDGNNRLLGSYIHEREVELRTLMSEEFRKIVQTSGVVLVSFGDLESVRI